MRVIDLIVIHCSATKECVEYDVNDIRAWHKQRGFNDVGYHKVIKLDGSIQDGRGIDVMGAHVSGFNANSIGICYVGGLDASGKAKDTRTPEQKVSLQKLVDAFKVLFPTARVVGHRDLSPDLNGDGKISRFEFLKECPSFDAIGEY